ncbi:hypothetical protein [Streptomyces lydicus]|uniref:hypothetical protein n=1 Tax=Streptomyces lydicus TaxID=47763 RepID=UPI0013DE5BE5|nr:hypothetical protein [Streptomyces lydicus]
MTEHDPAPRDPAWPANDHRTAEKVIKAVLIAAAVVGVPLLLYVTFFIGTFALAG